VSKDWTAVNNESERKLE